MKKLIVSTVVCVLIAAPAIGSDFITEQNKALGDIIAKIESVKDDQSKVDALMAQRDCIEKSTTLEELKKCSHNDKNDAKGGQKKK